MAEAGRNAYATTSGNAAAASPNVVAVVNDGTADRQIVVLGKGDGTTGIVDGSSANPFGIISYDLVAAISIASATNSTAITLNGQSLLTIHLTGTWSANLQVQVQADGSTWSNVTGSNVIINALTGQYISGGNLTANGVYQIDVAGMAGVRLIATTWASGTVTGALRASTGAGQVSIDGVPTVVLGAGANGIGSVTAAGGAANGAAVSGNPVLIGGYDGTYARTLKTDTAGDIYAHLVTSTTGGMGCVAWLSGASTGAYLIKSSAGNVYGMQLYNNSASAAAYVRFFNTSTTPTAGGGTPIKTIMLPAGAGSNITFADLGLSFPTGIGFTVTGGAGNTDTTAVAANQVAVNVDYI